MGWLGLDDTDSLAAGCTTYSMHQLLQSLPNTITHSSLRLVRLWPFARQRTRGNAAVAVELSCSNESEIIEYLDSYWKAHLSGLKGEVGSSTHDEREQFPADPGMVWFSSKHPPSSFYTDAVRSEVSIESVPSADHSWGGHGRIGATAAVAWSSQHCTWEAIAWRQSIRHGLLERRVSASALQHVEAMETTFLSRDPRHGRGLVSPRGPCPVLFGVRARDARTALAAGEALRRGSETEATEGMRVFATNQATDDHLPPTIHTTVLKTEVVAKGTCILHTKHGTMLAFSETGDVKNLAQWLIPGDEIEARGLVHQSGVIHLEKLRVERSVPHRIRPLCQQCEVRMKSMGSGQGSRCPKCKARTEVQLIDSPRTPPSRSWVQPPLDSRRHLARPVEWDSLI
ncbi:MAG: hypothetical protein CMA63_02055 [Euryarchaeota archaeon]|nr:hypothetical protein [Euryarchaeota archaeon]